MRWVQKNFRLEDGSAQGSCNSPDQRLLLDNHLLPNSHNKQDKLDSRPPLAPPTPRHTNKSGEATVSLVSPAVVGSARQTFTATCAHKQIFIAGPQRVPIILWAHSNNSRTMRTWSTSAWLTARLDRLVTLPRCIQAASCARALIVSQRLTFTGSGWLTLTKQLWIRVSGRLICKCNWFQHTS